MQVAPIDLQTMHVGTPLRPQLDITLAPVEKNWCFFEHNENLYVVYSFQPFHVLRLVDEGAFRFETVMSSSIMARDHSDSLEFPPQMSISTSPIECLDNLILFVHKRDSEQNYQHYAIWLDPKTLRPQRQSRRPVFSGGYASGLRPSVLYLTSVVRSCKDYWFFFGEGDEKCSFLTLPETHLAALLEDSIEIVLTDGSPISIAGEYVYEHIGRFRRTVILNIDGSIENGGDHDSHWRLEHFDGRPELWILGLGGISCRMDPMGSGGWSGIWNRGSRPQAMLTRIKAEN